MARLKGTGWFSSPNTIFDLPIGANEKMVLFCLCRRANSDGESFPSVKRIAADCSLSERTIRYVLNKLKNAGYLTSEPRETANCASTSNLYSLENLQALPGGATDAGGRVQEMHPHYIEGIPIQKESPIVPKGEIATWFEKFCAVYPRRAGGDGKAKAREIFEKHVKEGVSPEAMIEGARQYARVTEAGTRFVAQKTTWLNQRRWKDDYRGEVEEEEEFFHENKHKPEIARRWKEANPDLCQP